MDTTFTPLQPKTASKIKSKKQSLHTIHFPPQEPLRNPTKEASHPTNPFLGSVSICPEHHPKARTV